jgi:alpha-beta hydrolase superfamily lysophospholipase
MKTDLYFDSLGGGKIHACRWMPEGEVKAIVQFVHGIAEYAERYDDFAKFLNAKGILVVAEDHMGHGKSICDAAPIGCFTGGWMNAVGDTYRLLKGTMEEFPNVPYILFGHSMGSFMARTILARHPESGIAGAVICGSAWMPNAVIGAGKLVASLICKTNGEQKPSNLLQNMMFGSYNKKIEHPRTSSDWLTRDQRIVDAYVADPLCGFIPSAGLVRSMMEGLQYIQNQKNLEAMKKDLPVFFIAGGDDPVGGYGAGVQQAAENFKKNGMEKVEVKIYPLCRHEIHNELNNREVYDDVANWIEKVI